MQLRRILVVLVAAAVSTVSFYFAIPPRPADPPLILSPAVHDFGTVIGDKDLAFDALLRNTTTFPIRFTHMIARCDCTTTDVQNFEIAPGMSKKLPLKWSLQGRRGLISTTLAAQYELEGDSETLLTLPLTLKCDVTEEFTVYPTSLEIQAGEGNDTRIEFRPNPSRPPIKVTWVETTHPSMKAEIESMETGGQVIEISFAAHTYDTARALRDEAVIVHTDCKHQPQFKIPVRVPSTALQQQ